MPKNRCNNILTCLKNRYNNILRWLKTLPVKKCGTTFFLLFCIINLQANPFTGKQDTPDPVRTEKTSDFIVNRQAQLHTKLGDSIYEWTQTHSVQAFWAIIGLAFFYGIMHALGPGHRKVLVFSFYLTRQAPVWEPAVTSLILAGLHGITSIVLLLIFRHVSGALSAHTNAATIYLEGFSFILLLLLSGASILHLVGGMARKYFPHIHFGLHSLNAAQSSKPIYHYGTARYKTYRARHNTAEKIQWKTFLLSGIYPCPAVLLVLVLVTTLDAAGIGIITVIGMSAGMALPITVAAYLAWAGRQRLFTRIGKTSKYTETVAVVLALVAYSAIFIFSLTAVWPFIKSLIHEYTGRLL